MVFDQLLDAARKGRASTPGLFVSWANLRWSGHSFRSSGDVFGVYQEAGLETELNRLQAHLFSRDHSGDEKNSEQWNGSALVDALRQTRERMENSSSEAGLPPLYPGNLSVSGQA